MPRPQSDTWRYFTIIEGPDGKGRKASCSYCGHQQACGVTRLHQHLLKKCPNIPPSLRAELRQREEARARSSPPQQQQNHHDSNNNNEKYPAMDIDRALSTLAAHGISTSARQQQQQQETTATQSIDNYSSTSSSSGTTSSLMASGQQQQQQEQAMLDWLLARALFSANIPFSAVEDQHMISFLKRMRPGYVIPKAYKLQQHLLKEQHWDLIECDKSDPATIRPCSPTRNTTPALSTATSNSTTSSSNSTTTTTTGSSTSVTTPSSTSSSTFSTPGNNNNNNHASTSSSISSIGRLMNKSTIIPPSRRHHPYDTSSSSTASASASSSSSRIHHGDTSHNNSNNNPSDRSLLASLRAPNMDGSL